MKETVKPEFNNKISEGMLSEYDFDYSKAKKNRFACEFKEGSMIVELEPDVAKFFNTSKSVNRILRAIIKTIPNKIYEQSI